MSPVYPLVSLCRPRGPVNLGGGRPLQGTAGRHLRAWALWPTSQRTRRAERDHAPHR